MILTAEIWVSIMYSGLRSSYYCSLSSVSIYSMHVVVFPARYKNEPYLDLDTDYTVLNSIHNNSTWNKKISLTLISLTFFMSLRRFYVIFVLRDPELPVAPGTAVGSSTASYGTNSNVNQIAWQHCKQEQHCIIHA
jgi:hypothetical protein